MNAQRKEVLVVLTDATTHPSELFNKAFALYRKAPGKLITQERYFNRLGYNANTLKSILYELKKLHKISESEIKKFNVDDIYSEKASIPAIDKFRAVLLSLPEQIRLKFLILYKLHLEIEFPVECSEELQSFLDEENIKNEIVEATKKAEIDLEGFEINDLLPQLKDLVDGTTYPEEFFEEIEALKLAFPKDNSENEASEEIKKIIIEAPAEVKQEIKFRDEFPFINNPDLPNELKVLVTEKFNHYYAFCEAHKELILKVVKPILDLNPGVVLQSIVDTEIFGIAKSAIENFETDQLIYDEFVFYRDNKKILGKHPIFKDILLLNAVTEMTIAAATKRATNLDNYIRRDTKKAENAKTPEEKQKYLDKVVEWQTELDLVNKKLGIDAGK